MKKLESPESTGSRWAKVASCPSFLGEGHAGGKKLSPQTYSDGMWWTFKTRPVSHRETRIDQFIENMRLIQPHADPGETPARIRDPFYVAGFQHPLKPADPIESYLKRYPEDANAVSEIAELSERLRKLDLEIDQVKSDRDEWENSMRTLGVLGGRGAIPGIVAKYGPMLRKMDNRLDELTDRRIALRKMRAEKSKSLKEETARRQLVSPSPKEVDPEAIAHYFYKEAARFDGSSTRVLHLRMEAAGHSRDPVKRTEAIDEILELAEERFGVKNPESAQTGILIWKALGRKPRWRHDRVSEQIRKAIGMVQHTLAIYENHSVDSSRTAELHDVLSELYVLRAESGPATVVGRRSQSRWNRKRAAQHSEKATELRRR